MTAPLLDTNILVYSIADHAKQEIALSVVANPFVLSVQALNELANVLHRKNAWPMERIIPVIDKYRYLAMAISAVSEATNTRALDLLRRYNLSFYDALMVAAAREHGCEVLYSEDMQHGLIVDDTLTIINPFA